MRVALIKNGIVDNIAIGEVEFLAGAYPEHNCVDVTEVFCGPGMLYENGVFLQVPAEPEPPIEQ